MTQPYLLVLFDSRHGHVAKMARLIADGCEQAGLEARLRMVPNGNDTPDFPLVSLEDLQHCAGLALGSPVRFGQMTAAMKAFWEQSSGIWLRGQLIDKPGAVFTSSSSLHGGQEACLLGLMVPLLHHGMLIVGQPYDEPVLHTTSTGGTPYGPSAVATSSTVQLHPDEVVLCRALGLRLAQLVRKLA